MIAELECYDCILKRARNLLEQYDVPKERKIKIMKDIFSLLGSEKKENSPPLLLAKVLDVMKKEIGFTDAYTRQKAKYNRLMKAKLQWFRKEIDTGQDRLYSAIQYALLGNYVDFGALDDVEEEKLDRLLLDRKNMNLDQNEYHIFCKELEQAKNLLYITDNAGEIVLDRLLAEVIKQLYPQMEISILVRGGAVLNDATREDAEGLQFHKIASVFDNGTTIPGTQPELISMEAREKLDQADLIIAKGQGNFETLRGSGYPVYYLFLCKCSLFVKRFGVKQFTGVFAGEKRIVQII